MRLDPSNLDAKLEFAQLAILAGEIDEALAQAESVIAADPKNVMGYVMKGQALEGLKRNDEALTAFEKARRGRARGPHRAARAREGLRDARHDRTNADAVYVKLHPGRARRECATSATGASSTAPTRASASEDVEATFQKAIEIAKPEEMADAYAALASFYYTRDRFDDVVTLLEEGIKKKEDSVDLIYLLARFYSARGDEAKARELIEQATKAKPDDPKPFLILSAYRARQGDSEGALEAAEQALAVAPKDERVAPALLGAAGRDRLQGRAIPRRSTRAARSSTTSSPTSPRIPARCSSRRRSICRPRRSTRRSPRSARRSTASRTGPRRTTCSAPRSRSRATTPARATSSRARSRSTPTSTRRSRCSRRCTRRSERTSTRSKRAARYLKQQPDNLEMRLLVAQSLVRLGKLKEAKSRARWDRRSRSAAPRATTRWAASTWAR